MSVYTIDIVVDDDYREQVPEDMLRETATAALVHQRIGTPCDLAVVITGDGALQELNLRHLGIDAPTDVLAFPNVPRGPFVEAPGQPRYLGDVVISFPRARAQAGGLRHSVVAELQLLVVHGVLHLVGHDDTEDAKKARMWVAQSQIVRAMGVDAHPPE